MTRAMRRTAGLAAAVLLVAATAAPAQEGEARRLYLNAQRLEADGQLTEAMAEFRFLAEQFPSSEWADDSLLQVTLMQWRQGAFSDAAAAAQQLRDAYPTTSSAAGALFVLAEIRLAGAATAQEISAARDDFRRLALSFPAQRYPALSWRGRAKARAGEISIMLGDEVEAAGFLIDTIDNEQNELAVGRALYAFSELLARQSNWQAAGQALQQILDTPPATESPEWLALVTAAGRRISLLHRTVVRPTAGEPPWSRAFPWAARGTELDRPVGVAADRQGRLIIADEGDDISLVLDADRRIIARRTLQNPRRPWWTPAGVPMVLTEGYAARVDTRESTTFATRGGRDPGPLQKLMSGATSLYRQWFMIDDDVERMVLFSPEGQYIASAVEAGRSKPVDLVLDPRGRIYVLDRERKTVLRYLPDGSLDATVISGGWRRAEAIALDELGNLYVLDRDSKRIEIYSQDGSRRGAVGPNLPGGLTLGDPRDLAVDGSGRLYIADRDLDSIVMLQ